ncbi:hypothetical protein KKG22_05980 [Patescibacteria group bacterium]|nr:hypothetical protein [Patescibacteria group bacterium]
MLPAEFESICTSLTARYRALISEDVEGLAVPDLLSAEEQVVRFVRELGLSLLQVFVDVRAAQAKATRQPCACGRLPDVHRSTQWPRKTLLGAVVVRDPYVHCRICHGSDRPLHAYLGTDRETWSLDVQQAAVDLASDESCGKAVAKLERHHPGVEMERTTALRLLHDHGHYAREFIDDKLRGARELAELPRGLRSEGADELEVEFDAGMIPVATLEPIKVAEGQQSERTPVRGLPKRRKATRWEEVKAGLVQKPGQVDRLYALRPTGGLVESFDDLFALACMKGWTEQTQVRGLADGALHIRPRMQEAFNVGNFRFILDRPHCKEHLSEAGAALDRPDGVTVQGWATAALAKLEAGAAGEVVAELTAAWQASGPDEASRNDRLRLEAGYFDRNRDAVAYAEYRSHGWSTASSEIESGHRHLVQARLKISGAWWHPDHVDDILALRMVKANGWWDEYWQTRRRAWRKRAEGFAEPRRQLAV